MEALFGGMPDVARFIVAFVLVLGLIVAVPFLWRRFGVGPLSTSGPRGRQPRLAVIDAASVDGRRKLVLIRRDNTEHLLMIGGPTDIVIEPNIVRGGTPSISRERAPGLDLPPLRPPETQSWQQSFEPPPRVPRPLDPAEPTRPEPASRVPFAPERREAPAREQEVVAPPLNTLPPEAPLRLPELRLPALEPIPEPPPLPLSPPPPPPPTYEPVFQTIPEPPAPPVHELVFQAPVGAEPRRVPPRPSQSDENNLAEMAQRLEAALRRPTRPVEADAPPPPPIVEPAEPAPVRPPARAEPTIQSRVAAYFETPTASGSTPSIRPITRGEPEREPQAKPLEPPPPPPAKSGPTYSSLEEEMASLLGRSTGKT